VNLTNLSELTEDELQEALTDCINEREAYPEDSMDPKAIELDDLYGAINNEISLRKTAKLYCKRCGYIDSYYVIAQIRRKLIFNRNGEPQGEAEEPFYEGNIKRCLKCDSKVYLFTANGIRRLD
jgi:hypothetical protein